MVTPLGGLDGPCGVCRRRVGEHTLDEWATCGGATALNLPYEDVPAGPIPLTINGDAMAWADHLTARSALVQGEAGGLTVSYPTVIFTFTIGSPTGLTTNVAEVAYVASPDGLRKLGRVIRETCNGAANAAERSA